MNENDTTVEPTDFWYIDSKYHIHCEEYIEYHKDAMDWDLVSRYQTLSEPFIEKFADRVNWKNIEFKHGEGCDWKALTPAIQPETTEQE